MKLRAGIPGGVVVMLLILGFQAGISGSLAGLLFVAGLLLLRPRGSEWWPWLAVIPAFLNAILPLAPAPDPAQLRQGLESRCREMAAGVDELKSQPKILGLLAGAGEAVNPALPFELLARVVAGHPGRTAYLSDDRGRIVAYGGAARAYPSGIRPIGPRLRTLHWTALSATLVFREPLIMDGRLLGGITLAERMPREGTSIFGMHMPQGWILHLEEDAESSVMVAPRFCPTIVVPIRMEPPDAGRRFIPRWPAWLLLGLVWIQGFPSGAALAFLIGACRGASSSSFMIPGGLLLFGALAMGRGVLRFRIGGLKSVIPFRSRKDSSRVGAFPAGEGHRVEPIPAGSRRLQMLLILIGLAVLAPAYAWVFKGQNWLPKHLFSFGPSLVWVMAAGFVVAAWPGGKRGWEWMFLPAICVAVLSLGLDLFLPGMLSGQDGGDVGRYVPQQAVFSLEEVLHLPPEQCELYDLCSYLAGRWGLRGERHPALLLYFDGEGDLLSQWGDLQHAGDHVRLDRTWELEGNAGRVELWRPAEPFSLLEDWDPERSRDREKNFPLWSVVLTRSGMTAASLHSGSRGLTPLKAEELYRCGGGWTWLEFEGRKMPARIRKAGPWLVAEVIHWPSMTTSIARLLIAFLWILLAMALNRRPRFSFRDLGTFGGRLRLFVGTAVLIPLFLLTVVLQLRFAGQQREFDENSAVDAFRSARYTAENLAGGTRVDDDLARWLAVGWGGEAAFFDGVDLLASSRRDLMDLGLASSLPDAAVLPAFFLGRNEPRVSRHRGGLSVAGGLYFGGSRLLLQLSRGRLSATKDAASPVDWLLGGAALAALLALVLVRKIEEGLGRSLRNLVEVSRRLLHGEAVGAFRPPPERDLAEVVAAVEGMARKVQERESRMREQEEMLRVLLSTLAPSVFLLDEKGQLLFANPSAESLMERVGRHELESLLKNSGEEEELIRPRPGHDESWRVGSAVVPLPGGGEGRVVVIEDVSGILRAQRLEQLTQMARIVAHEVKNPLTPIRLWVQEMEEARRHPDQDLGALVDEACPALLRQVERLKDSANAFSNLVALEHWHPRKIDIGELIDETLRDVVVLKRQGIEIRAEHAGETPVEADPHWLRRALDTLILNSVTAIGEKKGEIVFRSRREGEFIVVMLEDSGGGVPPDDLDALFSPRFSSTRGGTGLGLALVQQVMGRAHGSVQAENGSLGLRVTLRFPCAAEAG